MLVSYYILAYNHEKLIERAVKSALNQDYSPLEIIISDDCSTDTTWEKIQHAVKNYQGPHTVITRKNEKNLGISRHINILCQMCRGEWIIASAGDDTSHPNRASIIMKIARQSSDVKLVQTQLNEVDEHENLLYLNTLGYDNPAGKAIAFFGLKDRLLKKSYEPHGAAMAYARELLDFFPDLPPDVIFEDNILNLRAELLGSAVLLAEPLVNHTNHDGQVTRVNAKVSHGIRESRRSRRLNSDISSTAQNISDINLALQHKRITKSMHHALLHMFEKRFAYFKMRRNAVMGYWPYKLIHLPKLLRVGDSVAQINNDELMRAAMPYPVYRFLRKIRG